MEGSKRAGWSRTGYHSDRIYRIRTTDAVVGCRTTAGGAHPSSTAGSGAHALMYGEFGSDDEDSEYDPKEADGEGEEEGDDSGESSSEDGEDEAEDGAGEEGDR